MNRKVLSVEVPSHKCYLLMWEYAHLHFGNLLTSHTGTWARLPTLTWISNSLFRVFNRWIGELVLMSKWRNPSVLDWSDMKGWCIYCRYNNDSKYYKGWLILSHDIYTIIFQLNSLLFRKSSTAVTTSSLEPKQVPVKTFFMSGKRLKFAGPNHVSGLGAELVQQSHNHGYFDWKTHAHLCLQSVSVI